MQGMDELLRYGWNHIVQPVLRFVPPPPPPFFANLDLPPEKMRVGFVNGSRYDLLIELDGLPEYSIWVPGACTRARPRLPEHP